jgi:hypothetical protein
MFSQGERDGAYGLNPGMSVQKAPDRPMSGVVGRSCRGTSYLSVQKTL